MRGQRIAASVNNCILADTFSQLAHFSLSAAINAVKDAVHQGGAARIHRKHAGTDCAAGNRLDVLGINATFDQKRLADKNEITPPVLFRPMFSPARLRHQHVMFARSLCANLTRFLDQHALGLICADINAKRVGHQV